MKKAVCMIIAVMCVFSLSVPALAVETTSTATPPCKENAEQMKEKIEQMQKKFSALSDSQKAEIYKIDDQISSQMIALAEKYAEFGILTADEANEIKEKISNRSKVVREKGLMVGMIPMVGAQQKAPKTSS